MPVDIQLVQEPPWRWRIETDRGMRVPGVVCATHASRITTAVWVRTRWPRVVRPLCARSSRTWNHGGPQVRCLAVPGGGTEAEWVG